MNKTEIIARRDALVSEQRQVNQQMRILSNQTYQTPGIRMAIGEMRNRLTKIDEELVALAEAMQQPERPSATTVPTDVGFTPGKIYTVTEVATTVVALVRWIQAETVKGHSTFRF